MHVKTTWCDIFVAHILLALREVALKPVKCYSTYTIFVAFLYFVINHLKIFTKIEKDAETTFPIQCPYGVTSEACNSINSRMFGSKSKLILTENIMFIALYIGMTVADFNSQGP